MGRHVQMPLYNKKQKGVKSMTYDYKCKRLDCFDAGNGQILRTNKRYKLDLSHLGIQLTNSLLLIDIIQEENTGNVYFYFTLGVIVEASLITKAKTVEMPDIRMRKTPI